MAVQKRNHKLHETERNLRIFKATSHEPIALKLGQLQVELNSVITNLSQPVLIPDPRLSQRHNGGTWIWDQWQGARVSPC